MKKILALILASFMLFALVACGGNEVVVEENGQQNQVSETVKEEKEPEKNYPDNILMNPYGTGGNVFFNYSIQNRNIRTVTFLDTLADMPADAWDVSRDKNGSVMAWVTDGVNLYIAGEGGVTASSCNRMFGGYNNVVSIDFGGCFYTDLTDRLTEMFVYCHNLETLDLSGWNVSNVKYMSDAFHDCLKLKSVNLSGWETSKLEVVRCMFEGCKSLESIDISHFDTSKVGSFECMFNGCKKLTAIDVSGWNTDSVLSMREMFKNCESLTSVSGLKIPEGCDTTDMYKGTPLA